MKNSIAIVIPTFNQKETILKTIGLLKEQTVVPDIVVVDNNSKDNTIKEISETYPDVIILKAKDNFGSSGGQYIGTRYAYEKNYDWIIMSDNDAYPVSVNLIEELVKNASPQIVTQPFNKYGKEYNDPILSMHYACYARNIFEKIGFPVFDFFLFGDDVEYSRRLEKAGFKINKLEHVFYFHPMKRAFAPSKFYFFQRNCLKVSLFYDKPWVFLFRSLIALGASIAYKIIGEDDCYLYGIQGIKHFLTGNKDNGIIQKTAKFFSPVVLSDTEKFIRENNEAFINVSERTNRFLKMESWRGKINNFKIFFKLAKAKKIVTETIIGYEAVLASVLFNNSLIAIESIDAEKVAYRRYNFYFFPKRFFLFFVYSLIHLNLFWGVFLKSMGCFGKNNPGDLNKKYDKKKIDFYLKEKYGKS